MSEVQKIEAFLRSRIGNGQIELVATKKKKTIAQVVYNAGEIGEVTAVIDEGETSWTVAIKIPGDVEWPAAQALLQTRLGAPALKLMPRGKIKDSMEVANGDEVFGLLYKEKTGYHLEISILDFDLED